MAKDILLKSFTVNDFGGIDASKPVLLYVEEAYSEGNNIAVAHGDMKLGKTSWLTALQGLLCVNLGVKEENFVNTNTKKLNASFEFVYKETPYRVTWTKSAFKLQKKEYNELTEKEVWRDELSPVETIKKLIGHVGTSPMNLKQKDGTKQVEEIRKALSAPKEVEEEEKKLLAAFEKAKTSRTEANREYTRLSKALEANPYYLDWEASEVKYKEIKTSEGEKKKLQELEAKKNQFTLAKQKVSNHDQSIFLIENDIKEAERQIIEWQRKLELKKVDLQQAQENKETGEKWIEENNGIVATYEAAQVDYMDIEKYLAEQKQWELTKAGKAEMDQWSDLVIKADSTKDDLKGQLLEIGKRGLPEIEGLEVITTDSIEGKDRGVYLHGKNVYQLSESELWNLFLTIWKTQNVKFIFIDNIQNLGTEAVETLNSLAAQNVKIFGTQMDRKQKEFKIIISDKIV